MTESENRFKKDIKSCFNDEFTTPYEWDLPLFEKLNIKPFKAPHSKEIFVGEVVYNIDKIKIWVTCMPAQFWRFEIYSDETKKTTKFSTGSGNLGDYWDIAEKISQGMLEFES